MAAQNFSSRFGFLMGAIGFAVGLGNIWRFPYVVGENGGSAFVAVYLICAFAIGVPILMAEIMLGRRGQATPPSAMRNVASGASRSRAWSGVGYLSLATAFLIMAGYGVVIGWVLNYLYVGLTGGFSGLDATSSNAAFAALLADVPRLVFWSFLGFAIAGAIISAGVQKGIERAVTVLMPLLFLLLVGLAIANVFIGGMDEALAYLFAPDFSKVTSQMLLAAIGQAFFSIGVAMAGMMMFGAYLPQNVSIARSAFIIVCADTAVAIVAGLVIFPMVFHNGLDPAGGTGLIFQTLPVAFAQMPGGAVIGALFFLLLTVAAITSAVGILEPIGAWIAEAFGISRPRATIILIAVALAFGMISVLSFNHWADIRVLGTGLGDAVDFLPNQVFLPLGGLLIAVFVGWRLAPASLRREFDIGDRAFTLWHNLLKYLAVPAVFLILLTGLFDA